MSLAYVILAHRQPLQVARLFGALHHRDDLFVLHSLHALGRQLAARHANVRVLPARAIIWGGPEMIDTQIEAMALALQVDPQWSHLLNLTGQDFPLKTRAEVVARLAQDPGRSFVSWFDPLQRPRFWKNARERIARYHPAWPWLHRLLAVPGLGRRVRALFGWTNQRPWIPGYRRPFPGFFRYFGGANHVVLARAAVRHLVHDPAARRIRRWLRGAAHSDEIVFQSVLLNSPLAPSLANESLREIDFPLHSAHPRTFTAADLPRLLASPALVARKFDLAADSAVFDSLEARVHSLAAFP